MPEATRNTAQRHARPRPRALRRVLILAGRHPLIATVIVLIALAGGLRLWWGWHAGRLLAAQLDDVRRRGEPMDPSELPVESVPDEENAWPLVTGAAGVD